MYVHTVVLISKVIVLGRANDCDTGAIAVNQIGRSANEEEEGRRGARREAREERKRLELREPGREKALHCKLYDRLYERSARMQCLRRSIGAT